MNWRKVGHPGVNVVFFDRMVSQDKEVKMARDLDEALSWARELRRAAKESRT